MVLHRDGWCMEGKKRRRHTWVLDKSMDNMFSCKCDNAGKRQRASNAKRGANLCKIISFPSHQKHIYSVELPK